MNKRMNETRIMFNIKKITQWSIKFHQTTTKHPLTPDVNTTALHFTSVWDYTNKILTMWDRWMESRVDFSFPPQWFVLFSFLSSPPFQNLLMQKSWFFFFFPELIIFLSNLNLETRKSDTVEKKKKDSVTWRRAAVCPAEPMESFTFCF